jgi:general secretion pathway protein M
VSPANLKHRLAGLSEQQRLRLMVGVATVLALALLYSLASDRLQRLDRHRAAREATLGEMMSLKERYREAQAGAQRTANRLAAVRADDTPARLMEEIGIRGKNLQVRALPPAEGAEGREEVAEVRIDGVTANEAVNLLYRLEKGDRPVMVRRSLIKTRFDDPGRLDLTLTIALQKRLATAP